VRKHPEANCEVCPLQGSQNVFVPSAGPAQATVAFVGEAPGAQEARRGIPFSGSSGDLLNTVMRHHGIKRREVLLTNACLCRPPDNATPPASAVAACRPRLRAELDSAGVDTAVALGNTAAQALTGRTGVTKLRIGSGIPSSWNSELRVVSTLHPAYCLRNADGFPSLVVDVGKVVHAGVSFTPPEYTVIHTPTEAIRLARKLLHGSGPLVVDIETDVEKDVGFGHPNQHHILCVGIGKRSDGYYVLADTALNKRSYRAVGILLRRRGVTEQNGKFDNAGLYRHTGPVPLKKDTLLASYCFDERPGIHGLKHQAQEYLGAPAYDDEIKQYVGAGEGYGAIPRDILYKYNAYDIYCTDLLQEMYDRRFSNNLDLKRLHDFLVAASNELMYVELNGIGVNVEYLDTLAKMYAESLRLIEQTLDAIVVKGTKGQTSSINPRSPQQVKRVMAEMGMRVAATDVEHLNKVIDYIKQLAHKRKVEPEKFPLYNFCQELLHHRKETKMYGTYVKGTRKRLYRGRVYPTFLLHGTTTGRLSCRNPNLQNVSRQSAIRDLFVPVKEGNVFVQTDMAQAELRVLCWLARDQYFRGVFNDGEKDLFDDLTLILHPGIDPATKYTNPSAWKEIRIRIKAFVYGLGYGRGVASIAEEYKIPLREAEVLKQNFFKVIPEIVAYQNQVEKDVVAGKDLTTPFGRHRRFMLVTDRNKHEVIKEGLAFRPQSISSDITLGAMVNVRRDLKGVGWVRNIVHDSILAECRQEDATDVAALMDRRMLESAKSVVGDYVKFATESKIGTSWGAV
jgi:uracil-DNA glycosylase